MAQIEVKVPQLSESVAEATLLHLAQEGRRTVARDENLIDIETDKVVLELPAPAAGVLTQIIKADGATVVAGEVIAILDTEASAKWPRRSQGCPGTARPPPRLRSRLASKGDVAMPAAAKLLAETTCRLASRRHRQGWPRDQGRRLAAVGSRRRTCCRCQAGPGASGRTGQGWPGRRPEERVPMSRLRARIAERLVQSQSTNAILTTFNEVNMQPVMDLRNKYKDKFEKEHGVKLGFMSFFVKAAVPP
jgi:2-oxoglutarate dehydrogenase E2 component (dihydrolipoamide succinyltransferase)